MCSYSLKRKWENVKIMCILGWPSFQSSVKRKQGSLCVWAEWHSWKDFFILSPPHPPPSPPRLQWKIFSVLCTEHDQYSPAPWGTGAAIRTYFTEILTGQEYHKQKRGNRFLSEIRTSFCSIHSWGAQLPKAIWQAPEKQNKAQKRWGGEWGRWWWWWERGWCSDKQAILFSN